MMYSTDTDSQVRPAPRADACGVTAVPDGLVNHYTHRHTEADRLESTLKGRLEQIRVRDLLARYLPAPPARVADIGGGPGVHAAWMQRQGHDVVLLDPITRHVREAAAAGISAVRGDARELPWNDESFDAAFLAGPLYHLIEHADRRRALSEAVRVVRPGGVITVIGINRVANLIGATLANTLLGRRAVVEQILETGYSPDNERMAHTRYHTVDELHAELTDAGLSEIAVHGLTGPGGWLTVVIDAHHRHGPLPGTMAQPDPLATALACARLADAHPDLVPASSLLFAAGRRG